MKKVYLTTDELAAFARSVIERYAEYRELNPHDVSMAAAVSEALEEEEEASVERLARAIQGVDYFFDGPLKENQP